MFWFIIKAVLLMAAPQVLEVLGTLSDLVSDASPAAIRGIEHIVFTMLLN